MLLNPIDDADAILRLINLVQPALPWTREHYSWQYLDNPAGEALLYGVKDGEEVVSLYAAVPHHIWTGDRAEHGVRVQDVMTLPAWRGKGLMHELAEECADDMRAAGVLGFTFPNKRSEASFRRTGWNEHAPITLWTGPGVGRQMPGRCKYMHYRPGIRKDAAYMAWRYADRCYLHLHGLVLKRHEGVSHVCESTTGIVPRCGPLTAWGQLPGFVATTTDRFMFTFGGIQEWNLTHGDSDVY